MKPYHRLKIAEREEISRHIASGQSIRKIAQNLYRSPSTISREIQRCSVLPKYYRAFFGQGRWNRIKRKPRKNRKLARNSRLRKVVMFYLNKKWSPAQVAKRLLFLYPNDKNL